MTEKHFFSNFVLLCLLPGMLLVFTTCNQEKTARRVPLKDFFRAPEKTDFKLSPDGKHISYLKPYKSRLNLYLASLDGKSEKRLSNQIHQNINFYSWTNGDKLIYTVDNTKGAYLYAVNCTGEQTTLLADPKFGLKLINPKNTVQGQLLVALNKRDSTVLDVYKLDLYSGNLKLVEQNPGNIFQWFADDDGDLRMALASDGMNETLLFRENTQQPFKKVVTNNFKSKINPVSFCSDHKYCIYAISNLNRDKLALIKFDCRTGKETQELFSHESVDVIEGDYSFSGKKLIFAAYQTWKKERFYLDSASRTLYTSLQKLLPQTELYIADQDTAGNLFIVRSFSDRSQGSFYLYKRKTNKLVKLTDINPSINPDEMCKMKPISFKNRSGLTINGYLTVPLGFKPKNLPLVVVPHAGPTKRDIWGFDAEVQFLANRGYAVFQVNYRGSSGYGKKFWTGGFKNWGGDIRNDITDGVHLLIKKGIVDKKRIAIYGSGFGGFCALNSLCYEPDLYACGASQSGYYNLFTYLKAVPPYYKPILKMYYEMVGDPESDIDYLRAASPVFHTDKIKVPVLIAQDTENRRVKVNETSAFVHELKKHKVPVTYIAKPNEQYNLKNAENRFTFYKELEAFLQKNLAN